MAEISVETQDRLNVVKNKIAFLGDALGSDKQRLSASGRDGLSRILWEIETEICEITGSTEKVNKKTKGRG